MIVIRKGKEEDIADALKLIKELAVYEKAPDEVEVSLEEMSTHFKNKIFDFFIAKYNNETVGIALYYYKYSTWKGKCIYLDDIIVTEKHRRKGIGKLLMDAVINLAYEENVRKLEWQVLKWNEPAIRFYQKYNTLLDDEWLNCKLTRQGILENINT